MEKHRSYGDNESIPIEMDFQLSKLIGSHIDTLVTSLSIFGTGHFNAKLRTFLYDPFCLEIIHFSCLRGEQLKGKVEIITYFHLIGCHVFLFFFLLHLMLTYVIWKLIETATQKLFQFASLALLQLSDV